MGRACLAISGELFAEFLKGLRAGETPRYFRVIQNAIPDDAALVDVFNSVGDRYGLELVFESATVPDGPTVRWPPTTFEVVHAAKCVEG